MKKTLTISFNEGNYVISDGLNKVTIQGSDLILKGQDLYDGFYKEFRKEEPFDVNVTIDETIVDSKDKHIAGDIKKILDEINSKLSKEVEIKQSETSYSEQDLLAKEEHGDITCEEDLTSGDEKLNNEEKLESVADDKYGF